MKKTIIAVLTVCLLASCGFLDIRTEGSMPTSGTDYTKSELIYQSVSAAYATMRLSEGRAFSYVAVLEIPSDDADKGSSESDGPAAKEMDQFTFGPSNSLINDMWIHFYDISSACNHAIAELEEFKKNMNTDALRGYCDQCAGEAKVIRAYAYFNLLRLFGSVPIVDRKMTSEELASNPARSENDIYTFIYKDLDEAIAVLPASYSKSWQGRLTVYSARALKAITALYRKDWNEAATQCDIIMASGKFHLLPDFRSVFSMDNENSAESLFEIQASSLGQSTGEAPVSYYAFIQGPRNNSPSNMQGWGFKVPSQKLVDFLTERGDKKRLDATILRRGTTTPEGDEIKETCANPYYNGKVYTPSEYNLWSYNGYGFDYNMRIIRYAEILLTFAEARLNGATAGTTSGQTAQGALDAVRERAGLASVPVTAQAVYDERRAELAMEECRFFDLVRTGQAATVLASKGYQSGKNEHFPIPATQRQLNPQLPASPGYSY